MNELLVPYLIAIAAFVVVVVVGLFAQRASEVARLTFAAKAARIPDFIQYANLRAELDELELKVADYRAEAAQAEALIKEAEERRTWLRDNEAAIQEAEKAQVKLESLQSQLKQTGEDVEAKLEELSKAKEDCRDAEWKAKGFREEADKAQKERDEAIQARDATKAEIATLERVIAAAKEKRDALEVDHKRLTIENEVLGKEVERLVKEKAELQQSMKELQARANELDTAIAEKEKELARLEVRAAAAQSTIATHGGGGGAGSVEDPLDEVKRPYVKAVTFAAPKTDAKTANEVDLLNAFKKQLNDEGLEFHPRVIDAFHTSLKVQQEAPLLVLAGISGTGKSLLPQRYADAFGMHSLMVPVQPRWDSPQDLLGFFNYLEGRYKPTELTRALVQFDQFGEIEIEEADALHDRMLLVLLDEMNLARVEYYFSEFLSRLENRRGLKVSDHEGRKKASLSIEVGSSGGEVTEHHVFSDRNVLFVGTINEDESTQTLSDKVVDRANVMRFGRPERLDRAASSAQEKRRTEKKRNKNFLPRDQWTAWIDDAAPLHGEHHKLAIKQISALNEALKEVGRPFAYRTRDAILAYARQYPNRTDARIKLALADQVEQRVLPKLRGIDPTDPAGASALRQVLEVVDQLGDSELSEAIERGKTGGHGHSFLWHGVDRTRGG